MKTFKNVLLTYIGKRCSAGFDFSSGCVLLKFNKNQDEYTNGVISEVGDDYVHVTRDDGSQFYCPLNRIIIMDDTKLRK